MDLDRLWIVTVNPEIFNEYNLFGIIAEKTADDGSIKQILVEMPQSDLPQFPTNGLISILPAPMGTFKDDYNEEFRVLSPTEWE